MVLLVGAFLIEVEGVDRERSSTNEGETGRLDRLERRFDVLVAELTAASAGRDRAHADIARLLEYFEFCLSEIGRLDDRIDSDVRSAVERFENEVQALKDRSADTSAQLQSIRKDQQAFVEIANDRALHASEVFAELQRFELDTRSAADAAAIDLAELADRLRVEHDDRIQALNALSSDEATAREQIERSLGERVDALLAGRDDLRRSLDELIGDRVGAVNHDVQSLMERLARSDESLAELRVGLEQVAGRDVVDSDDYAVLVELAEQLEQAVDQAAELADEALTRSGKIDTRVEKLDKASRKHAKALHAEQVSRDEALAQLSADRDSLRAELVALISEQSEASAAGRIEDREAIEALLSERVAGLTADRDSLRVELADLVAERADGLGEELSKVGDRLGSSDEALDSLRRAVDEVAGRDAVDVTDYESLVLLAADLEMRLGQVDSQMVVLDDEARKQASATDGLAAGRVEDREQLESLIAEQSEASSAGRDGLRAELVALIGEQSEASAVGRVEDREAIEALLSERVAGLTADRDSLRVELENLVAERADGLGEELSNVGDRLGSSDEALDSLRRAVDEVAGRDAVDVTDYESLVLLAADLEMRLGQVDSQMVVLDDEARKQASTTDELAAGRVEDREQLSDLLAEQADAMSNRHDDLRTELDDLVTDRVDAEVVQMGDRFRSTDAAIAELRRALAETAGRDVVGVEEHQALSEAARELEERLISLDAQFAGLDESSRKQASLTDELVAGRVEDREALEALIEERAVARLSADRDGLRAELEALVEERTKALAADRDSLRDELAGLIAVGRVEDREALEALLSERVAGLTTDRDSLRAELEDLVAEQVDGLGEVGERLATSDEALDSLRRAVDEVAGRDAVDVSDYEGLVLLAADLEMRLGQVDSQMAVLDDEARKQASVTEELAAERVEGLEQLSDLFAEQADELSTRHDDLRSELDELIASRVEAEERLAALDETSRSQASVTDRLVTGRVEDREALEALIEKRAEALEAAQAQDRTHMEALVVERVAAVVSERDELRQELDALVRERVESLVIDREDIRSDLDRLVVERTGELGADIAALDSRLVESDQMVDDLRSALDDVATRDVVARSEYEAVATLAGDLDVAVAEARELADRAIDRSNKAEASSDARHEQLVEQMDAAQSLAGERDARHEQLVEELEATRSLADERHEQIAEQVQTMDASVEEVQHELVSKLDVIETDLQKQSRALLDAAEETVELAIKAADKAESAADNADGIRADHDAAFDANREEFDSHSERIDLIEERETVERRELIEVDKGFREEIETLVKRLVDVERAVAEGPTPDRPAPKPPKTPKAPKAPAKGKGGNLIDLREPEAEKDRKFKRRGRW